ncbi:MAG TPA: chorismate synthase [Nevskiaceae bacterium]|nr:chorismate synthase [Nevskiaceae bacterium]
MSGNTFGRLFCVTSFGESHGAAIGCVVDGCPPGLALSEADLQPDLDRRRPGTSAFVTQRQEADQVRILSGVFEGRTTGTPIALLIENTDQRSYDYAKIVDTYRPNHADYAYDQKYGFRDPRGGGRSSARETAVRVAAAGIAKKWLRERFGVQIRACVTRVGPLELPIEDWSAVANNPFFCAAPGQVPALEALITQLRRDGDSVGARVEVQASGLPPGWGEPVFDRLDADLAHALMGINAVKGVEIGDGMAVAAMRGTEHRDEMSPEGFLSNHSGGISGGISTGQDLRCVLAIKPTSSITTPGRSINRAGEAVAMRTTGRHDPCVGLRAVPIAEAMVALVLIDHALRHRAQNADVQPTVPRLAAQAPGSSST